MNNIVITLNGQSQTLPRGIHLSDLIEREQVSPDAVATAVNGEFVARADRHGCELRTGDTVFTFQAITGG